ncbi:MAG: Abi family protein [Phycisphaeraceae bacterium]|nr:Abi family protein [Phycisphaeraceae bacterium]QYK48962.1 MAG: Abi family protein [Phycisphaeraceae bacterium]
MRYDKPPLSFEKQADVLILRGMQGDRALIIERLTTVGYYRLSAYWHPFRKPHPSDARHLLDEFKPGTTFDEVWCRYAFDRRLRLLVMDAIERIEVSLRALLATHHSQRYGAFAYATDQRSVPSLDASKFADYRADIIKEQTRSKDTFVKHFYAKYGDSHSMLPLWMAAEVMAFGTLLTFYRGCDPAIRDTIARHYGVHEKVFASWLLALNSVRNICAHHSRLWNRELGIKPKIPERLTEWHAPVRVTGDRVFGTLTICKWSLDRIAPQSRWADRLHALMNDSDGIPLESMGFPPNWRDCPIWKVGEV